ncbi:hypothetical protein OCGS_2177 [Oceaniovalibus guishaninsula JLT2003]|uniref:Heptosyltransferase family protein n=1 Tax=Oceaniovalibus guishaninsula JLT2003 TaxID=1231392 RepID=K2H8A4_9RHOB|nr:glycosyltransferase family 9 protein [Oceaniovalibus guishaninsula]EKE43843.1 hypothetical protein OCGS_2177 [Oceaniovalibus guishaninsula JLT2003]
MTAPGDIRRILFVELLGGLGDLTEALGAIQALARSHPRASVEVLTFAPGADLLRHDPHVAAVRIAPKTGARQAVEGALDDGPWDLAVSTTDYEGIGALIADRVPDAVTDLWRDPPSDRRAGQRFVDLLIADGWVRPQAAGPAHLFLTPAERAEAARRLTDRKTAALVLGAGMAIKRWPEERFAELGRTLRDRHGLEPLLIAAGEDAAADRIARQIGAFVLKPVDLRMLGAILGRCAVAIGGDTGPMRLAALAGTPTVMLFGPSWAGRYGLSDADLQAVPDCPERRQDVTAQACWWTGTCPLPRGPESCTHEIAAAEVAQAVARLPAARAAPKPRPTAPPRFASDWQNARRILVLRLDNIGDVLMTGPALAAIRASRPQVHVGLLASPSGAQAAPLLPWIDEVMQARTLWQELAPPDAVPRDPFDPSDSRSLVARIGQGRWDGAIVLTSFSQSPHAAAVACRQAGVPLVAGASDERGGALTHRIPKGDPRIHQADRNLALIRALGFASGDARMRLAIPKTARKTATALAGPPGPNGFLLLSPWASAASRQYAPDRMADAAARIAARHGFRVLVTGAPGDTARGAALAAAIPGARDLTGRTSVAEVAALVSLARLVLCCNSSAMHMAEALGVPAIVLFAGTELASQWAPRATPHRLLAKSVPCTPCHLFDCPVDGHPCLDVPPDEVAAAADDLLVAIRKAAS